MTEVRHALSASPEGLPLLFVAPKQTTYQLERRFLGQLAIPGYTRLHILSFERLAYFIFGRLGRRSPEMLDEEGRLMVLRSLLARKRNDLKLFRASARLAGFAQQLSLVLRELQRHQLTPESLAELAEQVRDVEGLSYKLQDLATLLRDYLDWLRAHSLQDVDCLLANATEALKAEQEANDERRKAGEDGTPALVIEQLWVDGFAEWSPQELDLLAALMPYCGQSALTFCLDRVPSAKMSWLSNWSVARKAFEECRKRFSSLSGAGIAIEVLERNPPQSRFVDSPVLQHLERCWAEPLPYRLGAPSLGAPASLPAGPNGDLATDGTRGEGDAEEGARARSPSPDEGYGAARQGARKDAGKDAGAPGDNDMLSRSLRIALCTNPEAEVLLAARETLRHVRAGGRYREVMVMVRKLDGYHEPLQRIFARYEIPFFLDRRESVSHHPLAEFTRSALRTVSFGWQRDDWFAALKTGLVPVEEVEIDRLENEALARGWQGTIWQKPIILPNEPELTHWLAGLHQRLLPPFLRLALAMAGYANKPTGKQLAAALRELWRAFKVQDRLQEWAAAEISSSEFRVPNSVHATVWEQTNSWLQNVELAFPDESLTLREWLPILDAGLANLTVGVVPPALDQVLIGSIDRSRNPDIRLALILGLNETLFPAPPEATVLLTDADRLELEKRSIALGATTRQQLGRERYYAYIACTRARRRLVLTAALHDANGSPLNPSPFLSQVRQLFPALPVEVVPPEQDWRDSEHSSELVAPLLRANAEKRADDQGQKQEPPLGRRLAELAFLPGLSAVIERLRHFQDPSFEDRLSPELATRLYGPVLRSSVSRMEQFAACPFKFFVHSGLKAEERKRFELDVREQGSFQHDVLALFHEQLRFEQKHWRDITPAEARERVGRIARGLVVSYRDGLLEASEQSRFMARIMSESLQDFVETLVEWMQQQYRFDPFEVELPFGEDETSPAFTIPLEGGLRLELYGRIDRVDICKDAETGQALCVVLDYKSSQKQLDPVLLAHGMQLQLLTYLDVMRRWPNAKELFGVERFVPAGVFYVSLRGKYDRGENRREALADAELARKLAYRHAGRFDTRAIRYLDARPDAREGDQFNYRLTKSGAVYKNSHEAMATADFEALLDELEENLKRMTREIFSGQAKVAPYRKGKTTACDQCGYRSICRIDPWTHQFRVLRKPAKEEPADDAE